MWIHGGPKIERKRKKKIKWNKARVKNKQDQEGPKGPQDTQNEKGKEVEN